MDKEKKQNGDETGKKSANLRFLFCLIMCND